MEDKSLGNARGMQRHCPLATWQRGHQGGDVLVVGTLRDWEHVKHANLLYTPRGPAADALASAKPPPELKSEVLNYIYF